MNISPFSAQFLSGFSDVEKNVPRVSIRAFNKFKEEREEGKKDKQLCAKKKGNIIWNTIERRDKIRLQLKAAKVSRLYHIIKRDGGIFIGKISDVNLFVFIDKYEISLKFKETSIHEWFYGGRGNKK